MTHSYDMPLLSVKQSIYIAAHDPIVIEDVHENIVSPALLRCLLDSAQGSDCCTTTPASGTVGVAATYLPDCSLSCLAFATLTRALVVHFSTPEKLNQWKKKGDEQQPSVSRGRAFLRDRILCDPDIQLYGYMMDRIAVAVFLELELRINAAVDILSVSTAQHDRHSPQAIFNALGGELLLQKENVNSLFTQREGKHASATRDVALQAWAACHAATLDHMAPRYATLSRIATDTMPVAVCNLHHVMHLPLLSDSYDSLYL
jgi:hypothetical protein